VRPKKANSLAEASLGSFSASSVGDGVMNAVGVFDGGFDEFEVGASVWGVVLGFLVGPRVGRVVGRGVRGGRTVVA
jgi:hypothetical protein